MKTCESATRPEDSTSVFRQSCETQRNPRPFSFLSWFTQSTFCVVFIASSNSLLFAQDQPNSQDQFDRIGFRQTMLKTSQADLEKMYQEETVRWKEALAEVSEASDYYRNDKESNYGFWRDQYINGAKKGELARQRLYEIVVRLTELKKKVSVGDKFFLIETIRLHIGRTQNQIAFRGTEALINAGVRDDRALFYSVLSSRGINDFQNALKRLSQLQAAGFRPQKGGEKSYRDLIASTPALDSIKQKDARVIENDKDANLPVAEIETTQGTMTVELFEDDAPNTVGNFIVLAERGFFNGQQFFSVSSTKATTGSPTNKNDGNSGFKIPRETGERDGPRPPLFGYLVMEVPEVGEISSQFSIRLRPAISDMNGLTAFGRIVKGKEVLDHIRRIGKNSNLQPDKIISVKITKKRNKEYRPVGRPIL